MLPSRRFFPAGGSAGMWLSSSPLNLLDGSAGGTATDPLGLVAGYELTSAYSEGQDFWDVWLCDTPSGRKFSEDPDARYSPANYAEAFRQRVTPWFDWLSDGVYEPVFRPAGVVRAGGADPEECSSAVEAASSSRDANGVVIVTANEELTEEGALGYGWCGLFSRRTWPESQRSIVLHSLSYRQPLVVAHEIGHALCWPHSYTGSTVEDGDVWQYDNIMDQMSAALDDWGENPDDPANLTIGTIAFNRYAAGWINPGDVEVHAPGTTRDYRLAPPGESGTQMIVLADPETGTRGTFAVLGARRVGAGGSDVHDVGIRAEGVEVYWIDQTARACDMPDRRACHGLDRRTVPVDAAPYSTDHVIVEGGTFWVISGYEITVGEYSSSDNTYEVAIRPIDPDDWHYSEASDSGDWSNARLNSGEHNLDSPYGAVTLDVSCSAGFVGATVYFWSQYIDWDYAWTGSSWHRAVSVSYRFGTQGQPVTVPWVMTRDGQGVNAPADVVQGLVSGLVESDDPLIFALRDSDGGEVSSITFSPAADVEPLLDVLRYCGTTATGSIPASSWIYEQSQDDALYGPSWYAYLLSFDHNLPEPYSDEAAALFVRCATVDGSRNVWFNVYLGGQDLQSRNREIEVAYRFGDTRVTTEEWYPSTTDEAAFLPRSGNQNFLSKLRTHDEFVWQARSASGDEVGTVRFSNLGGSEEAFKFVEDDCLGR